MVASETDRFAILYLEGRGVKFFFLFKNLKCLDSDPDTTYHFDSESSLNDSHHSNPAFKEPTFFE